jgi:hypothetical protein
MEEAQAGATSRQSYRDHADDLVILCKKGKADEALQQLRKIMSKLKLTVNEEKARICKVPEGEFDFLGYTFGRLCRRQSQLVGHARQVRQQGRCPHLTHYLATMNFYRNVAYAEVGCDLLVYPRDQDRSTIAYTVELVEVSYRVRAP